MLLVTFISDSAYVINFKNKCILNYLPQRQIKTYLEKLIVITENNEVGA